MIEVSYRYFYCKSCGYENDRDVIAVLYGRSSLSLLILKYELIGGTLIAGEEVSFIFYQDLTNLLKLLKYLYLSLLIIKLEAKIKEIQFLLKHMIELTIHASVHGNTKNERKEKYIRAFDII